MHVLARRERCGGILDLGHRHAIERLVVGEIEAVEVSIFRSVRHELLATHRLNEHGRVGDVPVVPIFRHELEMVLVVPGLGIEHDDRVGIEILSFAGGDCEVGSGIAAGYVQQRGLRIEGV
jgi:hypothetical protein